MSISENDALGTTAQNRIKMKYTNTAIIKYKNETSVTTLAKKLD
jgi:hypothetical protein